MATTLTPDVLQDDLAVSLACVLAAANRKARESGINVLESLITIDQRSLDGGSIWRVNYSPKDFIGRRGGDLIGELDPSDTSIRQVVRGQ